MLGLVLLYWIGKYFYKLAEEYDKSKWGFTILGVIVYYLGAIVLGGIILGFMLEIFSPGFLDTVNDHVFGIMIMPFGLLSCYLLYTYLKKTWKKNDPRNNNQIDLIGEKEE